MGEWDQLHDYSTYLVLINTKYIANSCKHNNQQIITNKSKQNESWDCRLMEGNVHMQLIFRDLHYTIINPL